MTTALRLLVSAMLLLPALGAAIPAMAATPNPFFGQLRAARADLARGELDAAEVGFMSVEKPRSLAGMGIDGLYPAPGGLLAIQNGTRPVRVLWLTLDDSGGRIDGWSVLEQDSPDLGDPNHGVVTADGFYFLGNSGWERVNAREELETPEGAVPPAILRLPLPLK